MSSSEIETTQNQNETARPKRRTRAGRPLKTEQAKRSYGISVNLTESEFIMLQSVAAGMQLSVSAAVRSLIFRSLLTGTYLKTPSD